MPGVILTVDTSRALNSLKDFQDALQKSGMAAKLTEKEISALEQRFQNRLNAEQAANAMNRVQGSFNDVAKAAGLTSKELKDFGDRIGTSTRDLKGHSDSIESVATSMTSLAAKAGAVAAAYVSLSSATSLVVESTQLAARYETLGVVLKTIGENAGYTAGYLNQLSAALQQTGISMNASRQSVAQMIEAHIDLASATKLARSAQDAAVIGNVNSSEAFQRMVYAIQSAQPEMLRTLGINVNFEASYRKLAVSLGTTADALTETQKAQARANETMDATRAIAGAYESAMSTAGKQALSLSRYVEDFKTSLGEAFQPAYKAIIEGSTEAIKILTDTVKDKDFQESMKNWAESFGAVAKSMAEVAKYAGTRSVIGTLMEGDKLRRSGQVDSKWWGEFTSGDVFSMYGPDSWNSPENVWKRERMVREATQAAAKKAADAAIMKGGSGIGSSSSTSPYTSEIPQPGELEKLYQGAARTQANDIYNSIILFTDKNKEYQSTSALLEEATKRWSGERSTAEIGQKLAIETNNRQMLADAEKMQAEADIKLIQTRAALMRADQEAVRSVEALKNSAMGSQSGLLGDKYGAAFASAIKEYSDEMFNLQQKMATYRGDDRGFIESATKYWAEYKMGIALARAELEKWRDTMSWWADMQSGLGELRGSPEAIYQGSLIRLQAQRADAMRLSQGMGGSQEEQSKRMGLIEETYALKARDAWLSAYKGMSGIAGDFFQTQKERLANEVEDFRKAGADELALRIYYAQQSEKIAQEEIQSRIGYEKSFSEYMANRAALDLGTYKGSQSRSIAEWSDYYDTLKNSATSFSDTLRNGMVDVLDGAVTGKADEAWKNLLSSMRRQFLQFIVDIAFDWAKHNIFKDLLGEATGANKAGQTSPAASVRQAVSAVASSGGEQKISEHDLPDFIQQQTQAISDTAKDQVESVAKAVGSKSPLWQRNNNPGNLRSLAGPFMQFETMEDGTRAMSDWFVRNGNRGYNTIDKILNRYAPPSENDTNKYVQMVSSRTGFARDQILDMNDPDIRQKVMSAMIPIETGRKDAVSEDMIYKVTHTAGTAITRDKLASKGILGTTSEDATQGIYTGASNYGVFGALLGTQGAQTLMGRLSYTGGMMSILGGDSVNSTFLSQVASATPSAGGASTVALAMMGGKAATQNVVNLTGGGSSSDLQTNLFAGLMAQGFSADQAAQMTSQIVSMQGTSSSSTAATVQQQQQSGGSNDMLGDLTKNGGSSWSSKLDQWGYDKLGIGSMTPNSWTLNSSQAAAYDYWVANGADPATAWEAAANQGGSSITGGLGSMAGGALTGAMTGYGISSLVYPNGTATVGGTVGGAIGGIAGTLIAGPIGGLVGGLIGGLGGSMLGGSETKKTEKTGSGITVTITGGDISQQGYSTYRTTTSGMFGSSSTSHSQAYDTVGDPELEAQFRSVFEKYQTQTFRSLINLGMTSQLSGIKDFSFPMSIDYDSSNASFAAKSMANYAAYLAVTNSGMQEEFDAVAKSGEVYVDELERISNAYSKGAINAKAAGTSLETLSGSMSKVFQGDWFSQLSDLLGGDDQATAAFTNYTKYGLSNAQAEKYLLNATASTAGNAIGQIGDASVTAENFWSKYGEAMNSEMPADQFALWANAASAMAQYSDAQRYSITLMQNSNNLRIAQLKAEMDAVQNVKVMVDGVKTSVSSAYSTYKGLNETLISTLQSIKWSSSLSPNTSTMTFQQQQSYYNQLKSKLMSEDSSSLTYTSDVNKLSSFAQTYLTTAKSYYGSSSQYWKIYNEVTGTLTDLQSQTQTEVDVLLQQLTAQNQLLSKNQEQIDQLTLVNENLAIVGSGIDGLGASVIDGLNNITSALGSNDTASWASTLYDSISTANAAIAASYASATTTTAADTSSSVDMSSLYSMYLGGYADGGDVQGPGWFMAGENGPEPVVLKGGSRASVTSNGDLTGSLDAANKISSAGFSALLGEFKNMRQEMAAMRAANERLAARPNRSN